MGIGVAFVQAVNTKNINIEYSLFITGLYSKDTATLEGNRITIFLVLLSGTITRIVKGKFALTTKPISYRYFWIILFVLLTACGKQTITYPATALPAFTSVAETPLPPFVYTVSYGDTCTSLADSFKVPVEDIIKLNNLPSSCPISEGMTLYIPHSNTTLAATSPTPLFLNASVLQAWQTQNALATPIRTPVDPKTMEKLPKVYIKDGNLYFQSSASQLKQLTNSGKDSKPLLADDGQKIVFYRRESSNNLYSINSDGGPEQAIITSETPLLIGKGDIRSLVFVPSTHIVLFNTYLCSPQKGLYDYPDCTIGVYSVDTDSKEVNTVVEGISGNSMRDSNFEISPDGKYVSVTGEGYINIYTLSPGGFKIAYPNMITYYITRDDEYLPKQYWLPDSSGLIIILAADGEYNEPATPPYLYVAFRFTIKDNLVSQIPLDKFIVWDMQNDGWLLSPDRNWILFAGSETGDKRSGGGLNYLGNLTNGNTRAYEPTQWPIEFSNWSPDSKHFTYSGLIGSVDGSLPISVGGSFIEWIDATHYYYLVDSIDGPKTYIGEIGSN